MEHRRFTKAHGCLFHEPPAHKVGVFIHAAVDIYGDSPGKGGGALYGAVRGRKSNYLIGIVQLSNFSRM